MPTSTLEFSDRFLEDSRRFLITDAQARFVFQHFGLQQGDNVMDVGCGTGYFTRLMMSYLNGKGRLTGIDIDPKLVAAARQLCPSGRETIFHQGDARSMEFPDNAFDVTSCFFLLSRLPVADASRALHEMVRVTRTGGCVAVFEPCLGAMTAYYPDNPRLSDLLSRIRSVKSIVQKEMYQIDENIGMQMPRLLTESNLVDVHTEIVTALWWTPPPFSEMTDDLRSWYERRLRALSAPDDQFTVTTYGQCQDAALGLRLTQTGTSRSQEVVAIYERFGLTAAELVECRELRVQHIQHILGAEPTNARVTGAEMIPVFAVAGRKVS